jgi:BirA family transcriptional regulator, biotin operon repressor / biotin---[acetyl-CoA-carboxylase] ligase
MCDVFSPLDVFAIRASLQEISVPFELRYVSEIDSTNRFLSDLDPVEIRHGLAVLTDYQSTGRGRRGRSWVASRGSSLLLSIALLVPPDTRATDAVMLGSVSVADALNDITSAHASIKWPNDVLLSGSKVCGILVENVRRSDRAYAIVGVGLNVNMGIRELEALGSGATSLNHYLGRPVSREKLAVGLFARLHMWYRCLQRDPDALFQAWTSQLDTPGKPVMVEDASGTWHGVAIDVRRDGGLRVRKDNGETRTVYAATVSIRPIEYFTSAT